MNRGRGRGRHRSAPGGHVYRGENVSLVHRFLTKKGPENVPTCLRPGRMKSHKASYRLCSRVHTSQNNMELRAARPPHVQQDPHLVLKDTEGHTV